MTRLLLLSGTAAIRMIAGGLLPLGRRSWSQPRLHEERSLPVFLLRVLGVAVTWLARVLPD